MSSSRLYLHHLPKNPELVVRQFLIHPTLELLNKHYQILTLLLEHKDVYVVNKQLQPNIVLLQKRYQKIFEMNMMFGLIPHMEATA